MSSRCRCSSELTCPVNPLLESKRWLSCPYHSSTVRSDRIDSISLRNYTAWRSSPLPYGTRCTTFYTHHSNTHLVFSIRQCAEYYSRPFGYFRISRYDRSIYHTCNQLGYYCVGIKRIVVPNVYYDVFTCHYTFL